MSRPWMGYLAGAAFALSTAGAAAAYAQAAPAAPDDHARVERQERTVIIRRDGDEQTTVMRHGDGDAHYMIMRHAKTDQAEHLRTMLQLKPNQEAALTAYLAATRPEHGHDHVVEMSDHGAAKTTPQRLAEMEAHMAEQNAQAHTRIEATRKFYDQLEPSQKKVFDELPMLMIGPMGPMMPMGRMKMMVNMERMPPMSPLPPLPPKPPAPPHS